MITTIIYLLQTNNIERQPHSFKQGLVSHPFLVLENFKISFLFEMFQNPL